MTVAAELETAAGAPAGDVEVVAGNTGPMDYVEAKRLTEEIHAYLDKAWLALEEIHDRRGWYALGYSTFAAYLQYEYRQPTKSDALQAEDGTPVRKTSQAYRLIDRIKIVKALAAAAGVEDDPAARAEIANTVSTKRGAEVRPHLDKVADQVRDAVADGADPVAAVRDAVSRPSLAEHARTVDLGSAADEDPADPSIARLMSSAPGSRHEPDDDGEESGPRPSPGPDLRLAHTSESGPSPTGDVDVPFSDLPAIPAQRAPRAVRTSCPSCHAALLADADGHLEPASGE